MGDEERDMCVRSNPILKSNHLEMAFLWRDVSLLDLLFTFCFSSSPFFSTKTSLNESFTLTNCFLTEIETVLSFSFYMYRNNSDHGFFCALTAL